MKKPTAPQSSPLPTPTPWYIAGRPHTIHANNPYADSKYALRIATVSSTKGAGLTYEIAKANAALIVRRVNEGPRADRIEAALRKLLNRVAYDTPGEEVEEARAALKSLEEVSR